MTQWKKMKMMMRPCKPYPKAYLLRLKGLSSENFIIIMYNE